MDPRLPLTRRRFFRLGLTALALPVASACRTAATRPQAGRGGARLTARPGSPTRSIGPGTHPLPAEVGGACTLYVPPGYDPAAPAPLLVMHHGAGPSRGMMHELFPLADEHGMLLLVPYSLGRTWDLVLGGMGPDVRVLDAALGHVFDRCAVDPRRIAVAGFSDGGSYALSLGLTNGDLFAGAVGFSPGFLAPPERVGKPRVFVSHGTRDEILPIDRTGRAVARQLRAWEYDLTYREFDGPHAMVREIVSEAMR
ncbi:MAG TPA: hypothetical protein VHG51_17510, partial [Longimicrobiaceae bacterium]|nr:hypothetical protein [Longimicrobiaceae bacterium]